MSASFEIKWVEFPKYASSNVDVRASIRNVVAGRMRRAMQKVAQDAAQRTPYPRIASAYRVEQDTGGGHIELTIRNDSPIWPYREYDTKPHIIRAGARPWLVFEPRGAGHLVMVKEVHHPGTKGTHTLGEAWDRNADNLAAAIDGAYNAILSRLGDYSGD